MTIPTVATFPFTRISADVILTLVDKLGGDRDTALFGAYRVRGEPAAGAGVSRRRDRRRLTDELHIGQSERVETTDETI
jgi:hypothetical protein